MGRGKSFNHKRKGHPGEFPKKTLAEGKDSTETGRAVADFATYEAYKNEHEELEND